MYIKHNKMTKILTVLLSFILFISVAFPSELAGAIGRGLFARAAMTVGGSGSLSPGSPDTAVSGIRGQYSYRNPPIRVSLYRNTKVLLKGDQGLTHIYNTMSGGFPESLTASIHFIHQQMADDIGSAPISIGQANTSDKTLTYVADTNAISNIVTMGNDAATPDFTNGIYYGMMKSQGLDAFKANWRSNMVEPQSSTAAWGWILAKTGPVLGDGTYSVNDNILKLFGGYAADGVTKLNYDDIKDWTAADSNEAYMRYLDMLMTLYTVSSGDTQTQWGQAVDDYLNSTHLQDSPISICIDSEALMEFNRNQYYILLPTVDYLEFATGIETPFAPSGTTWWATPGLTDQSSATIAVSRNQFLYAAQQSVANSPTFARISDYYTNQNGFSFAATAFTGDVLRTPQGGTPYWTAYSTNVLTDYFNIFKMYPPGADPGTATMDGYMIAPAPLKAPSLPLGFLTADPKNKVISTANIGMPVTLTVTSGVAEADKGAWETEITNAGNQGQNFNLTFTFTRTSTDVSGPPLINPNPATVEWSASEMMDFIMSGAKFYQTFDDTSNISTDGLRSITLNYTVNVLVTCGASTWTGSAADYASFVIKQPRIGYTSKPDAYSELKNYGTGSNLSGNLTENYEAMAGVPSTEQLYFAAGGSEFIVDITLEYIKGEIAKRSYNSYFTSTPSEFKDGDTAKVTAATPFKFPTPTDNGVGDTQWDPHAGGSFTVTWTDSVPNDATSPVVVTGTGTASATCTAKPNRDKYNAAVTAAQAYVTAVNDTTFSWTAASDKITRSKTGWGAAITTNTVTDPVTTYASASNIWYTGSGEDRTEHEGPCTATATKGADGTFTISITWTTLPHLLCGPECEDTLPEIHDTWSQTWTYDSMKIVDVHVWKIDQGAVDGLNSIINTDVIGASVVKGEPNIF